MLQYFLFTTEEITDLINKNKKTSIHEEIFPVIPSKWKDSSLLDKWEKLLTIRQQVNVAIEEKGQVKKLGQVSRHMLILAYQNLNLIF